MAEPVRRRVVEILASGEHSSGEITSAIGHEFGVTRSAVARHLAILRDEGWVVVRDDCTHRLYRLADDALGSLDREIQWLRYLWERRIGSIAGITPQPHHVEPFTPTTSRHPTGARQKTGARKGWRGRGPQGKPRRDDPWAP